MPLFRELFTGEILRPGEPVPAGVMSVMFTNVRNSSQTCLDLGDLTALRGILRHLEILTEAVQREGGTLIKTMGDRTMSVFPRPENAVRAALRAQHTLATAADPVELGIGIHSGPLIAITLQERMDYFGAAANLAAQLAGASGGHLVVTASIAEDPDTRAWLSRSGYRVDSFAAPIHGSEKQRTPMLRIAMLRIAMLRIAM